MLSALLWLFLDNLAVSLVFVVLHCLFILLDLFSFVPFRSETRCRLGARCCLIVSSFPALIASSPRRLNVKFRLIFWPFHRLRLSHLLVAMKVDNSAIQGHCAREIPHL